MAEDGSRGGHQDRTQARAGRLGDRVELLPSCLLQVVGELNNEDAILGYQTDEGDQSYLAVDVKGRKSQKRERQRPGNGQRHGAGKDDERIAEALKLCRQDQINQNPREQESAKELAALHPQLA